MCRPEGHPLKGASWPEFNCCHCYGNRAENTPSCPTRTFSNKPAPGCDANGGKRKGPGAVGELALSVSPAQGMTDFLQSALVCKAGIVSRVTCIDAPLNTHVHTHMHTHTQHSLCEELCTKLGSRSPPVSADVSLGTSLSRYLSVASP